jgi:hypothetical protein
MMDYSDYMSSMQTSYSNLYSSSAEAMQPILDSVANMLGTSPAQAKRNEGCREEQDCSCSCCIRCADLVEYAHCGEVRQIPITFENETRRERAVKLQLGSFVTDSGQELGWQPALSETEFKLPPCGEKTVVLTVNVDCGRLGNQTSGANERQSQTAVDSCKVAYATLRGDGCIVRPLVIAVAVLPLHCGAHHAGCGCGCCC